MNWANDFLGLYNALSALADFEKVLDCDDGDTISEVNEETDFPLVVISFEGHNTEPNSYGQYIEGSHEVSASISVKREDWSSMHEAKTVIRPLVIKFFATANNAGYSINSKINYSYGLIGSTRIAKATFIITK
jgi:hypothetical protein